MAENAIATVLGGFWSQYAPTLSQIQGTGSARRRAAQALNHKGVYDLRARMTALDGVAPGAAATKNYTRIVAAEDLSGVRAIETQVLINRVTVAGDVTIIEADINTFSTKTTFGASPPANLDGNPLGTR